MILKKINNAIKDILTDADCIRLLKSVVSNNFITGNKHINRKLNKVNPQLTAQPEEKIY